MVKKMKSKQLPLIVAIGIGIAASLLISVGIAAMVAFLMSTEKTQVSSITVFTAITHLISAFLGTWIACTLAKEKRLITVGITLLGYILILLATTALFFGGQYSGISIGILMAAIGGCVAILIGLRPGKVRSRKHKIPAYR